ASGGISPPQIRSTVVLPAPFSPTSATASPARTANEAPSRTTFDPNRLDRPVASSRHADRFPRLTVVTSSAPFARRGAYDLVRFQRFLAARGVPVLEVVQQAVEAARKSGAGYADARFVSEESESLTVKNQEMEGIDRSLSEGIGIRVLVDGYWGFAATARPDGPEIERTAALAVAIARASSRLPAEHVRLADVEPAVAEWSTEVAADPFA